MLLWAVTAGAVAQDAAAEKSAVPPNIVVVITDDESWLERSVYGWSAMPTPAFDRVAKGGVLFNHAYSSAPSCAPARAALMTGRNFWELEQGAIIQAWLPKTFPVVQDLLADAGYLTGSIGKGWGPGVITDDSHSGETLTSQRWSKIKVKDPQEGMSDIDYPANFAAFVDSRKASEPFYCWVGIIEPHGPWAKDGWKKLRQKYRMSPTDVNVPGFMPDTGGIRRARANSIYEMCYADEQLGRILDILEERGELENTIVIATSDNGTAAIPRAKATGYDWGVHVPLAILWPKSVPGGRVVEDFVGFQDFAPTMLQAAGVAIPESMSGSSLLGTLESDASGWVEPERDAIVTGLEWHGELAPENLACRTIRDKRYAYTVLYGNAPGRTLDPEKRRPDSEYDSIAGRMLNWANVINMFPEDERIKPFADLLFAPTQPEELYDLEKDPWQTENVIDDPAYADVKERLKTRLHAVQVATGDPRVTGDMKVFDETRAFVQNRKEVGYSETK